MVSAHRVFLAVGLLAVSAYASRARSRSPDLQEDLNLLGLEQILGFNVNLNITATSAAPSRDEINSALGDLAGLVGLDQTFDYVVVGAGNAGLPLAYRLAEDPGVSVALVEAGGYYEIGNPLLSSTPAGDVIFCGSSPLDTNPFVDWDYVTSPQAGAANREIHYARGRCLGGSSGRNFMIYQRGTKGSYQQWADNIGDQSYTFENLLPYFQKSVHFTPPNTRARAPNATVQYNTDSYSATGGPGQVSYANYAQTFSSYMEGGLNEIGLPKSVGFEDGVLNGTSYCASTIDPTNEFRASSEETFLNAAINEGKTNLKVFALSLAKKIIFDSDKRATGIEVAAGDLLPFLLNARKEVIISAGAFNSPQLLMVSGVGPTDQLTSLGIPIVHENPNVGQNMWDHVFAGPTYQVALETFTKLATDVLYLAESAVDYFGSQAGPLTNPVSDFLGWEHVPSSFNLSSRARAALDTFASDWPEFEYISGAGYVGDFADLLAMQPPGGKQYGTILSTLVKPLSRGNVTITSADTADAPVINPNWLTDPTDQELAIIAFKRARQAFATSFMAKTVVGPEVLPGAQYQSDEQILEVYRNTLMTVWHASCTCKMGAADDPTAVVDPNAKVIGVSNLRVVDASAFNLLPPGHPMSTVYALAEKIADDIKNGR